AERPLALADPGRRLRDLPLPEALHVALPPLAGGDRRSRAGRRLGGDHGAALVARVGPRRGCGALGGRLRPLLLALRRGRRPRAGAALRRRSLRRTERLPRRPARPPRGGRAARDRRRGPPPRRGVLGRTWRSRSPLRLRALARPAR